MDALLPGRTAILIAHRLSTATRADRIVVVANGGIAEVRTQSELIAKDGVYAEIYAAWINQSGEHEDDRPHFAVNQ
jgi:ATP-binding cassette subfamily B protein